MPQGETKPKVNLEDYIIDVLHFPDEPLHQGDRILYTDCYSGRSVVARAPLCLDDRISVCRTP